MACAGIWQVLLSRPEHAFIMMNMRTRTTIALEPGQLLALKARARANGISVAQLVRGLVTEHLKPGRPRTPVPLSTFERMVGLGSSGRADIADGHDALLADALRNEHGG